MSIITDITDVLAEESDYQLTATLVGPDGTTPVEPAAVQALTATLRDLDSGAAIYTDRDVRSGLGAGGAFVMNITAEDNESTSTRRFQRRLLTLKITQTDGKMRKHVIRYVVENLADVA